MRGGDERSGSLFSYVDLEARVGRDHPLRMLRMVVNEALAALSGEFSALYARMGRPSIPPKKLLRAMLLQAFYSIRSERQLMEWLEFDLLFRWFVGLGVTMWCGITRRSPRTAIACWRATSPPSF
jgi:transposase